MAGLDLSTYSDRTISPEQTVERMWPHLEQLGITRVARQTSLDRIGIPTWAAFRPNSLTLAGSQGKGLTDPAACASAIMESAEAAVAERPSGAMRVATAQQLRFAQEVWFDPTRLLKQDFDESLAIRWLRGRELLSGQSVWVPLDVVDLDGEHSDLRNVCKTTNGLASGNTTLEAVFHALCELIERDGTTLASLLPLESATSRCFRAEDLNDPAVNALKQTIERAGLCLTLFDQTSDLGVPVVMAIIAPLDTAMQHLEVGGGWGCHPVSARAAVRAITEAAQGRVTAIAASRDDLTPDQFERQANDELLAQARALPQAKPPVGLPSSRTLSELLQHLLRMLARRNCSVIGLDISHAGLPFAVAKLLSVDLEDRDANLHWRPGPRSNAILEELA